MFFKSGSFFGASAFESRTKKNPATPPIVTIEPTIKKNVLQFPACVKPSSTPNTKSVERSGSTASTDSVLPRWFSSVMSLIHALNAASLAELPKKVIIQSITITKVAVTCTAAAAPTMAVTLLTVIAANAMVERPHKI